MVETTMQMLQRHVHEGKARIARQELLIARLERQGYLALHVDAKRFLDDMREHQTMAEQHLADRRTSPRDRRC